MNKVILKYCFEEGNNQREALKNGQWNDWDSRTHRGNSRNNS